LRSPLHLCDGCTHSLHLQQATSVREFFHSHNSDHPCASSSVRVESNQRTASCHSLKSCRTLGRVRHKPDRRNIDAPRHDDRASGAPVTVPQTPESRRLVVRVLVHDGGKLTARQTAGLHTNRITIRTEGRSRQAISLTLVRGLLGLAGSYFNCGDSAAYVMDGERGRSALLRSTSDRILHNEHRSSYALHAL
jgi:hypothetical protein